MTRRIQDADVKGSADVTSDARLINDTKIYVSANGINQRLDQAITAGTIGGGGINYVTNGKAESATTGWATYADAAGTSPVDGTGGTATGLTFSRSTSSPLRGSGSFLLAQANSTSLQGKGVSYDFTIDSEDQARLLAIQFDYNASSTFVASSGTTDSDIEIYVYDKTNAVLVPVTPKFITSNGSNNFSFSGTFQTASNSTSYRLIFHVATTSANATGWNFKFDNVSVGPQTVFAGTSATIALSAGGTPATTSGASAFIWPTVVYDTAGGYNSTTGRFTAPFSGVFRISGFLAPTNTVGVDLYVNGSNTLRMGICDATGKTFTGECRVNAGDLIDIRSNATSGTNSASSTLFIDMISNPNALGDGRVVAANYELNTGTTSLANNTTTIMNFDLKDFDTHGAVTTGTGTWRFTAPVSGIYYVGCAIEFAGGTGFDGTSKTADLRLFKNGSLWGRIDFKIPTVSTGFQVKGSDTISLVAGDFIDFRIFQNSGISQTLNNQDSLATVFRLSGPAAAVGTESVSAKYDTTSTSFTTAASTTAVFTNKLWDTHNAYNTTTGLYTAPISGKYRLSATFISNGSVTSTVNGRIQITPVVNGSTLGYMGIKIYETTASVAAGVSGSTDVILNAGDTVGVQIVNAGSFPTWVGNGNLNCNLAIDRIGS